MLGVEGLDVFDADERGIDKVVGPFIADDGVQPLSCLTADGLDLSQIITKFMAPIGFEIRAVELKGQGVNHRVMAENRGGMGELCVVLTRKPLIERQHPVGVEAAGVTLEGDGGDIAGIGEEARNADRREK